MSRPSREPGLDSMEAWFSQLPKEHQPSAHHELERRKLETAARQRWGTPSPDNITFQNAIEDGYLTEAGELTEEGIELLKRAFLKDAVAEEKKVAVKKKEMVERKASKQERQPSPAEQIVAVFTSHGLSLERDFFSVQVNDRALNTSTKNYRLTLYGRSSPSGARPLVQIFEGTISHIVDQLDGQAVDLSERMNGMSERRPRQSIAPEAQPEISVD